MLFIRISLLEEWDLNLKPGKVFTVAWVRNFETISTYSKLEQMIKYIEDDGS